MPIKTKHEQAISIICHTSIDSAKSSLECDLKNGGAGYPADALRECLAVEKASGKPRSALIKLIESHISRREKMSHSVSSVPSVVKRSAESESKQLATQLTDQYRRAISGTREILIFGAMMLQLGGMLSRNEGEWEAGRQTKGTGLKGWIQEHCPAINYETARSFCNLARGLVDTFALAECADLPRLLSAPVEDLSGDDATIRAQMDDFIEGKSKRQLEFDFGIRRTKKAGGNPVLMLWLRDHPDLAGTVFDVDDISEDFREDYEAFRQEYLDSHNGPKSYPLEYYQQRWTERIISLREFVLDKEEFRKLDESQLRTGYQALQDCITHLKKHCHI